MTGNCHVRFLGEGATVTLPPLPGDAEWIADLLRQGLLKASFIPPLPQRDLRDLTRQRTNLVQDRARVINQLQKVLEWANLKHRFMLTQHLMHIDFLEEQITNFDAQIAAAMQPQMPPPPPPLLESTRPPRPAPRQRTGRCHGTRPWRFWTVHRGSGRRSPK